MWLNDSGASYHMSGNRSLFSSLYEISSTFGCLWKSTVSTMAGKVTLGDNLVFENVLYVPALNCNLLSVSHSLETL